MKTRHVFKGVVLGLFLFLLLFGTVSVCGAASYQSTLPSGNGNITSRGIVILGHNINQGVTVNLPWYRYDSSYIGYIVPDDGCTWEIIGSELVETTGGYNNVQSFTATVTTSGTFSGPSPGTATTAANNAYNAANTAASNAATAATNAQNAYNAANTAASNASSASSYASAAASSAASAANNTVYNSQSAAYWANTANTNASSAANNTTYSGNSAAYWAYQANQSAASAVVPAISSVTGQNGATCTTGSTFTANVAVSPASNISYTVAGVPGYAVSGNSITFTGLSSGVYTASITATYTPSGKTAQRTFIFFKI